MLRILLFLSLWMLAAVGRADTLLVLGDSLSAGYGMAPERGWVQLLQQRLEGNGSPYRVVNASISGDTTQGGLQRLPTLLERHQPVLVLIELGANDGLRGTPPALIGRNLRRLVELAQQQGAEVLLLAMRLPPNYGPRYARQFHELYADVSKQTGAGLIPFFLRTVVLEPELMQADGLHPNADAQPMLLEQVWPYLRQRLLAAEAATGSDRID
ncbi:arylesterase [Marinobacterium arenosum]|uniref:arylesterase n=1 Tax=Marinobacterium arenosum TaxID=2862496 RepID=UPI001C966AEB|nr:arylesterase [Marinobacterium arenosum]MBY4679017.1 arylesterase [Marinobacterium arenosum]